MSEPTRAKPRLFWDSLAPLRESVERLEARNREERLIRAVTSLAGSGVRMSIEYVPAPPPAWPPAALVRAGASAAASGELAGSTTAVPEQDLSAEAVATLLNTAGLRNRREEEWTAGAIRQRILRASPGGKPGMPVRDPVTAALCSAKVERECRFRSAPLAKFLEEWTRRHTETTNRIRSVVAKGKAAKRAREKALD